MNPQVLNHDKLMSDALKRGFTLLELIIVMAIILIIAGIGFGVFLSVYESAREEKTNIMLESVSSAMEARAADISSTQRAEAALGITAGLTFPNGDNSATSTANLIFYISGDFNGDGVVDAGAETKLTQVLRDSGNNDSYVKQVGANWLIVDAWGTPIRYQFPGVNHTEDNGFDLESAGADKKFGADASDPDAKDNIILQ
jgi:general secretion pathway protein G